MKQRPLGVEYVTLVLTAALVCYGCATPRRLWRPETPLAQTSVEVSQPHAAATHQPAVRLASHRQPEDSAQPQPPSGHELTHVVAPHLESAETLSDLEALALADNPTLRRMYHEKEAAWAKTGYVNRLPDPTVSTLFFAPPMNFEPDRQVAEVQVMQMIPWLTRLQAEAQQAHLEALVAETQYQAEQLRVIGELRVNWYRLYVLRKQLDTVEADQAHLKSLVTTATAGVRTGATQPGDVLMATLELTSLQEQLLSYRQQLLASSAEINRLIGRDASVPLTPPTEIEVEIPDWDHDFLRHVALENQPELNAARLRTAATRWGIEVARLKRRPDLTFGVGWVVMDAPGAIAADAGRDSLTLGVSGNIPIRRQKYDAMASQATREHDAAHASEDEIALRLEALLRDLGEQARASQETVALYEESILPQARQTLAADQQSLANNTVPFDRVIRDYRTLLNLELGHQKAIGQLAMTLARIRQATGVDLISESDQVSQ